MAKKLKKHLKFALAGLMIIIIGFLFISKKHENFIFSHTQIAHADDFVDPYPWINTGLFTVGRTWTQEEKEFVGSHYELIIGALRTVSQTVQEINPDATLFMFSGLAYLNDGMQNVLEDFLQMPHSYTEKEIEDVYLHYDCDTVVDGVAILGCNLINPETGECSESPDPSRDPVCAASSASQREQSRVPNRFQDGWFFPNYQSDIYREVGVYYLNTVLNNYPQDYLPHGIFWDNILYLPDYIIDIENTELYPGIDDDTRPHPRTLDYYQYFHNVKDQLELERGESYLWMGNVNGFHWIASDGPYIDWVLDNLSYVTPESWVSPISVGESGMPWWGAHCEDMKEAWEYTTEIAEPITLEVLVYNHNNAGDGGSDMRTREFGLVKYYLVKNDNLYYGTREGEPGGLIMDYRWNPMAEVDIGQPKQNPSGVKDFDGLENTNKFFNWVNPTDYTPLAWCPVDHEEIVTARYFDHGLVIARWKANKFCVDPNEPGDVMCTSYVDERQYNLTNQYGDSYYQVKTDGSLELYPISSIGLKTNEAAVLLQACDEGIVTDTCGCNGEVLDPGETCILNTAPVLDPIGNQIGNEGELLTINLSATDGEEDELLFSMDNKLPGSALVDNHDGTAQFTWTPDYEQAGVSHSTVFRVTDNIYTDSELVQFTISNTNRNPTIVEIDDKVIHEMDLLEFTVVAVDEDVDDSLTLTANNLPVGATFIDNEDRTGTFSWRPTVEQAGLYKNVTFMVDDLFGGSSFRVFTITIIDGVTDCSPEWDCTDWSICVDSYQTRQCSDQNSCGTDAGRPDEVQACDSTAPGIISDLEID